MSIQDNLLKDFPQHSSQEWKDKINKDLKSKSFEDLTYLDASQLKHKAFFTKEDLDQDLMTAIQSVQKLDLDWTILKDAPSIEDDCIPFLLEGKQTAMSFDNGFHIDGLHYKHLGATIVNELTAIVQHLMFYTEKISQHKLDVNSIVKSSSIYIGTGLSYFSEIAKYRAIRFLCSQILEQSQVHELPKVVGIVSPFYYSHLDAHTNLLRATSMGMSAVLGGVEELYIAPYDDPIVTAKGKRWAMNIQHILKHESHFEKILDPAAGSYYVEHLSIQLVNAVWAKLKEVEAKGGMFQLHQNGKWLSIFKGDHDQLIEEYKSLDKIMIGANKFKNENGVKISENSLSISNSIES